MKRRILIFVALLCVSALFLQGCDFLSQLGIEIGAELSANAVYSMCAKSVVEIHASNSAFGKTGTGFFSDAEGTVITNYHVIEGCTDVQIMLYDGTEYPVTQVLGYDAVRDIAILDTDYTEATPLTFGSGREVYTGQKVYTIGSSLGLTSTFSEGIVSCAIRILNDERYIQVTAPISPGNSGGPLLDTTGTVIGINSACMVDGQNLNFAIPIGDVDKVNTEKAEALEALFTRKSNGLSSVKVLQSWGFEWSTEQEKYALYFELSDQSGNYLTESGSVDVEIVNDAGEVLYEKTLSFTAKDIITIEKKNIERKLSVVYISEEDITEGKTPNGTVTFRVRGVGYYFEAAPVRAYNLPVDY